MSAVSKRLAGRLTLQLYAGSLHVDISAVQCSPCAETFADTRCLLCSMLLQLNGQG